MAVRMSDIADSLRVSRSTVSRVLSGQAQKFRIAPETAERIVKEASRRGYRPSQLARGLRTASTRTLGLVVSDISNPFFANLAWAAEQAAEQQGFAVVVGSSGEDPARELAYIENLRSRGVDGLLVAPAGASGTAVAHLAKLKEERFPLVLIDRIIDGLSCDGVAVENRKAARALTEALLNRGARRIAFLGGREEASTHRERLEGFLAALKGKRIKHDPALVLHGDFSVASGQRHAAQLLELEVPPDALVCANNKILIGCLERLASAPAEPWAAMPMASFDEVPFLTLLRRPMVIAKQPERQLGARAVALLLERLKASPEVRAKSAHNERLEVELKEFGI